jgi:predicted acetyltransferase
MDIRTATSSDTEELAQLYAVSFPSVVKTHDEWCAEIQPNAKRTFDDILIASEQGRVAGALTLYRYSAYVSGSAIDCGGVGSVAVLPQFRLNGIGRQLMESSFGRMRSMQLPLSLLYPFKQSFYQKLGYGLISDIQALTIPSSVVPRFSERDNVHPLNDYELEELMACYDAYAKQNNFCLVRSADIWRMELKRARRNRWSYWCCHSEGAITGYMLVEEKDEVIVRELVYLTPLALRGLLGFLAVYKTHSPLLIPYTRDEFFHLLMTDPVDALNRPLFGLYPFSGRFGQGLMMRIIDVPAAMKQRRFRRASGSVTFHLLDDQIALNSAAFTFVFKDGEAELIDGLSPNLISLTVSTFAQLFAGYMPFSSAVKAGLIDAYFDVSFLDEAFALPMPRCLDFF